MVVARLWRLSRAMQGKGVPGMRSGRAMEENVIQGTVLGFPENAGLGGLEFRRFMATTKKGAVTPKSKTKKGPQVAKGKKGGQTGRPAAAEGGGGGSTGGTIEDFKIREPSELVEDGLFLGERKVGEVTPGDINKYYHISEEDVGKYFAEGFPKGMVKEFEMARCRFVRVRSNTLEMLNRLAYSATGEFAFFHSAVMPDNYSPNPKTARDPKPKSEQAVAAEGAEAGQGEQTEQTEAKPVEETHVEETTGEKAEPAEEIHVEETAEEKPETTEQTSEKKRKPKFHVQFLRAAQRQKQKDRAMTRYKHLILDGPAGCGKSFTLGVMVQWARARGWLVFYVPRAKEWTRGGFYYLNELTGLWDTPLQAQKVLQGFLDSHSEMLEQIKCRVPDPIILGEAAAVGRVPGPQELSLPEGSTLKELVEKGLAVQAAASNIVVRLRQELDLVTEFPVLIAVDEFNSWFTFSEFNQFLDFRKTKLIHARELGMVNAFRKMENCPQHYIAAFSQSTVVGKLPLELPGAPKKYRIDVARLDKKETDVAVQYYKRQNLLHNEPQEEAVNRLFFLTNGNGAELRKLVRYI